MQELKNNYSKPLFEILTVKEVAAMLRISDSELRKIMLSGDIKFFEIGAKDSKRKSKRFRLKDVEDYVNNHYFELVNN